MQISNWKIQKSNHSIFKIIEIKMSMSSRARQAREQKRREDAHALPKLSRNGEKRFRNFARKCFRSAMRPRIAFGRQKLARKKSAVLANDIRTRNHG